MIVYAVHGQLQTLGETLGQKGGGIQAYKIFETSLGSIRLPAIAKPTVLVRMTTWQILNHQKVFPPIKAKEEIFNVITHSFNGIKNPKQKSGFLEAFNRFKAIDASIAAQGGA